MKCDLVEILACPTCRSSLALQITQRERDEVKSGTLRCGSCVTEFPILHFVPRFVPEDNYARSFGFQWTRFPRTQFDSYSKRPLTRERFFRQSGWTPDDMAGETILDVGCGAGRFAEVALSTGARVVAVDYSVAVDAAYTNLGTHPRIDIVQADVYALPFRGEVFDAVYCFGVLQHTPDVSAAFRSLLPPLKRGGRLAVDVYPKTLKNIVWPKYWLRPFLKNTSPERLFRFVTQLVTCLLPLSRTVGRIPIVGKKLRYLVPIVNYEGVYPLDEDQLREWSILDTFDMYAPAHDHPQTAATLRAWLAAGNIADGEVVRHGHLVARGIKR